ncbi:MAG: hypothetical protein IKJ08_01970 [Alistipes sp.]|nr:hypothetical protein [Alistipes sp.]
MRVFSLSRVANYMRYCYTAQAKNYAWNVLCLFFIPLFFALLGRDISVVSGMSQFVYIVAAVVFPVREVMIMRDRGTRTLAMTLPVSNEERWVAMVINLALIFPIASMVATILAFIVAEPFSLYDYSMITFGSSISLHLNETYFEWSLWVFVQLLASSSLFLAIMARKSLVITYLGAFIGFVLFMYSSVYLIIDNEWFANVEVYIDSAELIVKCIFCMLPALFYALSYVALRRRQVKW